MVETLQHKNSVETTYAELLEREPKIIFNFVPADAATQKDLFLNDKAHTPHHTYSRLDDVDPSSLGADIQGLGNKILENPELYPKYRPAYEQFIDNYSQKVELLRLAQAYNHAETDEDRQALAEVYMAKNIEIYGEPDESTYRSLLNERLRSISCKELDGEAAKLRDELFALIDIDSTVDDVERFRPSSETVEWMHGIVESLYGDMLAHVPEGQDSFNPVELQKIFTSIVEQEFSEAAGGWKVDVEAATSINVISSEKRIVIPDREIMRSRSAVEKLIVHELGVHMLRAVMGGETDLSPLANGLSDYYDAEEGLGVVMEQALEGRVVDRGADHYITAGLAYYDKKDFRGAFEVKWRLALLNVLADDDQPTPEQVEKARATAYGQTMRTFRGTDDLPLFKDLSYFNGSNDVWRHLEKIRGDDMQFMFVLLGKLNPANKEHERLAYETHTL